MTIEQIIKSNEIINRLEKQGYYTRYDSNNRIKYIYEFDENLCLKREVGYITFDLEVIFY